MSSHCHWFHQFSSLPKPIKVILGNNSSIPATGQGRILVRMNTGDGHRNAVLQDVLYVPDLSGNLLSVSHFARRGAEMHFVGEGCQILDQRKEITCIGHLQGNLYTMDIKVLTAESAKLASVPTFPLEGNDPPALALVGQTAVSDRKSTRLNSSHRSLSRMPSSA